MSRGPETEVGTADGADYLSAFRAANRLANEGLSWSGNERNCCFLNTGQLRFANVGSVTGLDFADDGRAFAITDWDADGDLDLIQMNRTGPQLRFLRNDWQNGYHWLSLELVGTRGNRDAIGARMELYRPGVSGKDVRTLYAGNSFLSQSSKQIHFGLGQHTDIDRVVVRWPGGTYEEFRDLRADQRYRLIEGTGRAQPVERRAAAKKLVPSKVQTPAESEQARVLLSARAPLPSLPYAGFDKAEAAVNWGQPTLIQLWASWCPKCQGELSEFARRATDVHNARLQVLALCVDGVGEDHTDLEEGPRFIRRIDYPYTAGRATETLLGKLETLRGELFSNSQSLPVPTSLLIDAEGHLVAIYFGAVSVDQVLADIQQLPVSAEELRRLAIPLSGRWFTPPKPVLLMELATAFRDAGYVQDAQWYEQQAVPQTALRYCALGLDYERQGDMRSALASYQKAIQLDPQSGVAYNYLGEYLLRRRETRAAIASFQRAIALEPRLAEGHYNLATAYLLSRDLNRAKAEFREAIKYQPRHARAHAALGRLLEGEQREDEAEQHFRRAIEADPNLAPPHVYLGVLLARRNNLPDAEYHLAHSVQLAPDLIDARLALGDVLAAQGKRAQAVVQYRQVIERDPQGIQGAMRLAWHLATSPDAQMRSAAEAVRLAERVAERTERKSAQALDVLAAAYAEAGRFDAAVATAREAQRLAAVADSALARQIAQRVKLYERRKPYRQARH